MLSRSVLPLLRPRTFQFQAASRRAFSISQIQAARNPRDRLTVKNDFKHPSQISNADASQQQPLRTVPTHGTESIRAESPAHDPEQTRQQSQAPGSEQPSKRIPASQEASGASEPASRKEAPVEFEPGPSEPLPDLRQGIPSDYNPSAQSQKPLPDLTQGIPSTIDAELEQASRGTRASKESLNIPEEGQDPGAPKGGDRGGEPPRSSYVSSSDRRRSAATKYFYILLGGGSVLYAFYMGRDWSDEEAEVHKDIPRGYTPALMYQRASARWGSTVSYYTDPVTKKLLPDAQVMDPNMPPYTLVIGLEDVLVHSEWSREHGWRIAKRPGLDYFIKYLSPYYELVLFSSQPSFTVDQIHRKIDPYQMIYPLYREMTVYEDGGYVKDLSYLNRDLKKVVVIDSDPHHVKKQPENAIVIPPWTGDPKDTTLIDLIPFLENLASLGYQDTREVLKSFKGKNIAEEFDRRQKLLREKWEAQQAEKRKSRRSGGFGLGSMFGSKPKSPDGIQSIHDAEAEGKMYSDIIRERGQDMYQRLVKHLETEGPKILAEREALEKKMQDEAMANMKTGMFGWFGPSQKKDDK